MTSKPLSVLLVDDDPHTRNIFQIVMEHHNHQVNITEDANGALDYLKDHSPDVIVLDIFLPGTDGYQIFNQIRRGQLAPNSSIVATTAYHTSETQQDVLSRGFDGYLPKPLDSSTLVPYIENIASAK